MLRVLKNHLPSTLTSVLFLGMLVLVGYNDSAAQQYTGGQKTASTAMSEVATPQHLSANRLAKYSTANPAKGVRAVAEVKLPPYINPNPVLTPRPDFAKIKDIKQKKRAFFSFMEPMVASENRHLLHLRGSLSTLNKRGLVTLTTRQRNWLEGLAKDYELKGCAPIKQSCVDELLLRIDIVPPSIALAQGANESAWGTSRFAIKGNNFFGHWCYKKGCGLIPKRRNAGARQEVALFTNVAKSVRRYMHNLNTHYTYKRLHKLRASLRAQHKPITGLALVKTLDQYSQRRGAYVKELRAMIRYNHLDVLDSTENKALENR